VLDKVDPDKMQQMWKRMQPMPVDKFATRSLDDIARNKAIVVWPIGGKIFWLIDRLSPGLAVRMARSMYDSNQQLLGLE